MRSFDLNLLKSEKGKSSETILKTFNFSIKNLLLINLETFSINFYVDRKTLIKPWYENTEWQSKGLCVVYDISANEAKLWRFSSLFRQYSPKELSH